MKFPHIAVIGLGVVGRAVMAGSRPCKISAWDKYKPELNELPTKITDTKMAFVCVPTPTSVTGGQDLTEIYSTCKWFDEMNYKGIVAIKSTVRPGTMRLIAAAYPRLRLVHNPEFLCEKTAKEDFRNQEAVLLSGRPEDTMEVGDFYAKILRRNVEIIISPIYEATEFAKYIHNCILPVTLSFLNEVYDLAGEQKVFDQAVKMAMPFGNLIKRNRVPGPDGKRGWGGMCFVKDTLAMIDLAHSQNRSMPTLEGAVRTNKTVRIDAYNGKEKTGLKN